jgi:1,4-dihydroxy-2-naphthoate octaprenyltransferase
MNVTSDQVRQFINLSRPLPLLIGGLVYGIGATIVAFLGRPINWSLYFLGQAIVSLLQLTSHYLLEYHEMKQEREENHPFPYLNPRGSLGSVGLPREVALYAAIVCLVLVATLTSILLVSGSFPLLAWLILLLIFLGTFFYNTPPIRLIASGYGELTYSVVIAALIPSLAFTLQTGEFHRLLIMSTSPLVALHLAMMISFELPDYAHDIKTEKRTIMVRLGWASAMRLHDLAIIFALVSFVVAYINGLPRRVTFGVLIALPLAITQIWQMQRIRRGFPVRWRPLTFGALGLFGLTSYLVLIGYILS